MTGETARGGPGEPAADLDPRFSDPGATPTPWSEAHGQLKASKVYFVATVRPDGRPHVTPVAAVWVDGALHFTTGKSERKAQNLHYNQHCIVTTGCNTLDGLDVVVEGEAVLVKDESRLERIARAYIPKYDRLFVFTVRGGSLWIEGSDDPGMTYEVQPTKAFGFRKGTIFSQTRWLFGSA